MPLVPARALVLALALPACMGVAAAFEPSLVQAMLALDALVLLVALLDALGAKGRLVDVQRTAPAQASLRVPTKVAVELENRSRRKLQLAVNDACPVHARATGMPARTVLEPFGARRLSYELVPERRGQLQLDEVWVRYPSRLGLWQRQLKLSLPAPIKVLPDVRAIRQWQLLARVGATRTTSRLTRFRGGDTEFERLRDHQPDDELKRVDWRATARRRRLTVRDYQLERDQSLLVLLDCGRTMTSEWKGMSALDHALDATLMLSQVATRRGDKVGMLAYSDRVERFLPPRGGLSAANQLVHAAHDLFPEMVEADLDNAVTLLGHRVRQRTLVVLLTHALDERAADRMKRLTHELLPRHLPLIVLLRDEDLAEKANAPARGMEAISVQAAATEVFLWRDRLLRQLEHAGALAMDARPSELTGALLERYLEVKARGLI